jgi:hypothetical protein
MRWPRIVTLLVLIAAVTESCSFDDDGGKLVAYFRDVGDLVERSTVQIADVEVGTVQDIDLVMQNGEMIARVTMSVPVSTGVPADGLQAVVRQTSLLGEQFVLRGLAGAEGELRSDIEKLRLFLDLLPGSMGGGPGDRGKGDYIQADAVVCEVLGDCNTRGEKGDVPGEGSR